MMTTRPLRQRRLAVALILVPVVACDCSTTTPLDPDAGVILNTDASPTEDASTPSDAGPDASPYTEDAGQDASTDLDAGTDASTPDSGATPTCQDTCTPAGFCFTAYCEADACIQVPLPAGTSCGEEAICVAGACVTRGCGDGYREPGPDPAREACDDGNLIDGDACSQLCEATISRAEVDPDEEFVAVPVSNAAPLSADADGNLLFVWLRDYGGRAELVAQRRNAGGAPLVPDEALVLDDALSAAENTRSHRRPPRPQR